MRTKNRGFQRNLLRTLAVAVALTGPVRAESILERCEVPGIEPPVACGTVEVWEDRAKASGRRIAIHVIVARATAQQPKPDPIFFLTGGPGQAASMVAAGISRGWRDARATRDLVFVDQRGTGKSNPLTCGPPGPPDRVATYLYDFFAPGRFRPCLEQLARHADLRQYTTPAIADDLEEVRQALGYGRVNLRGGSYGSWLGLVYMRRHPESVRSAIFEGAVPDLPNLFLGQLASLDSGLEDLVAQCAAEPTCHKAFPDLEAELKRFIARLEAGPVATQALHPVTGALEAVILERNVALQNLRLMLYVDPGTAMVPFLVREAVSGNWVPFATSVVRMGKGMSEQLFVGMTASVRCAEVVNMADPEAARRVAAGTLIGGARLAAESKLCAFWPRGLLPEGYHEPISSDIPVLMVTGQRDVAVPWTMTRDAASRFPNGLILTPPGARHALGALPACYRDMRLAFLDRGSVEGIGEDCPLRAESPPFATRWPFGPTPGRSASDGSEAGSTPSNEGSRGEGASETGESVAVRGVRGASETGESAGAIR